MPCRSWAGATASGERVSTSWRVPSASTRAAWLIIVCPTTARSRAGHELQLGDVLRGLTDQPRQVAHLGLLDERGADDRGDDLVVAGPDLLDLQHCQSLHR